MIRLLLAWVLLAFAFSAPAGAQGTITDADASFVREATPWDNSPGASFVGVSTPGTQDHLFETGWALRLASGEQEIFFPAPDIINYPSPQSFHIWNDLVGGNVISASETSVVVDLDGPGGPTPSGLVTMTLTINNLNGIDPLTFDLFHVADFDLQPTAGNDSAALLSGPTGPVIRINGAGTNFAVYTGDDADAFLVRPFGPTDLGSVLSNLSVDEFDNTGLPFGPGDFTAGMQWNDRMIPPGGSASFVVRMSVNNALLTADLRVEIDDAPDPVVQGQQVEYTVTVHNDGPDAAPGVIASTLIPVGLSFVDTLGCAGDPLGVPDCSLGTILPGSSKQFLVRTNADIGAPGLVTLDVSAASSQINEVALGNNADSEETTVLEPLADLSILVSDAPDPVLAGQTLNYTVTVQNDGPIDATGVVVTMTLPAEASLVATNGCAEDGGGVPTCTLGALAAGFSVAYTVETTVSPSAQGVIGGAVNVTANEPDNQQGNNNAEFTTEVTPLLADLQVAKTNDAGGLALVDVGWTWTLLVTNTGNQDAQFAVDDELLIDQLPNTNVVYAAPNVSTDGGVTGTVGCNVANADLSCTATSTLSIPPGGTVSVSLTALPDAIGAYVNPRLTGICSVDPTDAVNEFDESDNSCSDIIQAIDFLIFADSFED